MKLFDNFPEIDERVEPEEVDLDSFAVHNSLNPEFWDGDRLDARVRRNLLRIARDFIEDSEVDMSVEDVIMTGSLANYNWSPEYSDIDLHIVTDFSKIGDGDFVKEYFDSIRKTWNERHKLLKIHGYPVEIYVQDKFETLTATGIYSLLEGRWKRRPKPGDMSMSKVDSKSVRKAASEFMTRIDDCESDVIDLREDGGDYDSFMEVYDRLSDIMDDIKSERKSGLGKSNRGEMSDGNIVFKTMRRSGYIEKLYKLKTVCYDLANSI